MNYLYIYCASVITYYAIFAQLESDDVNIFIAGIIPVINIILCLVAFGLGLGKIIKNLTVKQ